MACSLRSATSISRSASDPDLNTQRADSPPACTVPRDDSCARAAPSSGRVASSLHLDVRTAEQLSSAEREDWPDGPVTLTVNPAVPQTAQQAGAAGPGRQWLRVNPEPGQAAAHSIEVDSGLFQGHVVVWLHGLPSTPAGMFSGKKRLSWVAVQGRFKREVAVEELWSGQELGRPLRALPARWFVESVLLRIARAISSSMQVGPLSAPTLMSPLMALAQVVNVSLPGQAPDMAQPTEDCRLLNPALVDRSGAALPSDARRAHFNKAGNRKGLMLTPDHVYTFHMWQQFIDLATYKLDLGVYAYSLPNHLAGQPLQIMIKHCPSTQPPGYLFNFQVWHKALLPDLLAQRQEATTAKGAKAKASAAAHKADIACVSDAS